MATSSVPRTSNFTAAANPATIKIVNTISPIKMFLTLRKMLFNLFKRITLFKIFLLIDSVAAVNFLPPREILAEA